MSNWFHRFLNPHCSMCAADNEEKKYCAGCDAHLAEIQALKEERDRLLNHILHPQADALIKQVQEEELKPIMPRYIPWHVRRRMKEEQDRSEAQARANAPKSDAEATKEVEELEEVLLDPSIPTEVALEVNNG